MVMTCKKGTAITLESIVEQYLADHAEKADGELRFFESQKSVRDAVRLAGLAQGPSGKRFDHQRRIPSPVLEKSAQILNCALQQLSGAHSFHDLYQLVAALIGPISGIGDLTIYDTALRIGAKFRIYPERVYLHAGTKQGAKYLRLSYRRRWLVVGELPQAFQRLKPYQVEDVLCIYKNELQKIATT